MQRLLSLIGLTLLVVATPAGAQKRALSPSDQQSATALTRQQPQSRATSPGKQGKADDRLGNFEIQRLMSDSSKAETLRSNAMRKMECPPNCAGSAINKIGKTGPVRTR
jgi:hypothetical protein